MNFVIGIVTNGRLRSTLKLAVRLLSTLFMLSAFASTKALSQLPVPEFFGFYAAEDGHTVAMYEGQDAGISSKVPRTVYSIPKNGSESWTTPVLSPSSRFILFYANAGEMIKSLALYRLPTVRNVIERPDFTQSVVPNGPGPRVIAAPGEPLLAKIPELENRILVKPVPNQAQMVELVPSKKLEPGLYVVDYAPASNQGWHIVFSVESKADKETPFCVDLNLPGGYGGLFERANSELSQSAPLLGKQRYTECDSSTITNTSSIVRRHSSDAEGGDVPSSCTDYSVCIQAGSDAYQAGRWGIAAGAYTAAAKQDPKKAEPWIWLGRIRLQTGQAQQPRDIAEVWDKALALGAEITIGACHERVMQPCEKGDLILSAKSVAFLVNGTRPLFAAAPGDIEPGRVRDFSSQHIAYTFKVVGKGQSFDFIPYGVTCTFNLMVQCPPDGSKEQLILAQYVSDTLPKIAHGIQ